MQSHARKRTGLRLYRAECRAFEKIGLWEGYSLVDVSVRVEGADLAALQRLALSTQDRFRFCAEKGRHKGQAGGPIPLHISHTRSERLFSVDPIEGVTVSTWQSGGICIYAGIPEPHYYLLCSMLGLNQWRALSLNPLLRVEDFAHDEPANCLYVRRQLKQDHAVLLDTPFVCQGCLDFYRCLGLEPEMTALMSVVGLVGSKNSLDPLPESGAH